MVVWSQVVMKMRGGVHLNEFKSKFTRIWQMIGFGETSKREVVLRKRVFTWIDGDFLH